MAPDRAEVDVRLREILRRHTAGLDVRDDAQGLYVESRAIAPTGGPMFVGAVRTGKAYVSYHLTAVYAAPELLSTMSPGLRRRMQGKSCFNFTKVDEGLFDELDDLTRRGIERLGAMGFLEPGARIGRDGKVSAPEADAQS